MHKSTELQYITIYFVIFMLFILFTLLSIRTGISLSQKDCLYYIIKLYNIYYLFHSILWINK